MSEEILQSIIGIVIGAIVTFGCSWYYFKRASDDLVRESKRLEFASTLILAYLQNLDAKPKVAYDEDGVPKSIVVSANMVP